MKIKSHFLLHRSLDCGVSYLDSNFTLTFEKINSKNLAMNIMRPFIPSSMKLNILHEIFSH